MVQWVLGSAIRDKGEYEYSLQTGNAGVADPKAWKTIQTKVDTCVLEDTEQRLPGSYSFTHYRVRLKTDEGIYYSKPLHTFGKLNYADLRMYEAVLRAESVQLTHSDGVRGTLLKRKISGIKCPRCRDFGTGDVLDGNCAICYGTGWVGGYYAPIPCFYINVLPSGSTITRDVEMRGVSAETAVVGRAIASPILISGDVWVNGESSERYKILQLKHVVEVKGIPVVYQVGMERIPFSDVIYKFKL